jgi:thiamine biosynthesis lipoprotein
VANATPDNDVDLEEALRKAERVIRDIEAKMSNWIDLSELSRFNRGEDVQLSTDTITVLQAALKAYEDSHGAFDITCRPLIELWKEKGNAGVMPTEEEIQAARDESHWDQYAWEGDNIIRNGTTTRVDLGGIAKGYAIDLAVASLKQSGVEWGMVDIGGDLSLFNTINKKNSKKYDTVEIKHPFQEGSIATLQLENKAVCTSGNYARYITIDGINFSHIIDPRSGYPATIVPSVTVIADSAMEADVWATAISVLGKDGLEFLPDGVEAFLILGMKNNETYICSRGFHLFFMTPILEPMHVYQKKEMN